MNILVAEDNKFTARQYKILLEKMGHKVITTQDGSECVKKYKEQLKSEFDSLDDTPFDLVLLDHNMPKKTGAQAAKEILAKNPNQKILFISGFGDEVESQIEEAGWRKNIQVVEKPFSSTSLVNKVEQVFQESAQKITN